MASDLSNRYLWGPVVDQLLADEQIDWTNNEANGEVLWALTDHLGTVRDLVNDAGVVQNHKSYDAFGNVTKYKYDALNRLVEEKFILPPEVFIIDDGDSGITVIRSTEPDEVLSSGY